MTSAEIRQSFLDFFKSKQHTIVPSSSLMPDSPNLLFTNAGMNQFVPIFLGQRAPDVSKWAGAIPGKDTRAADTQKCIRAGGKHNDLEDVGLDTYHHTFFEMLGNWSFGDYFKEESIAWGWELLTKVWGFPPNRLYATVYKPDLSKGDPSFLDEQCYRIWKRIFQDAGLDPDVHIVFGGKKDNFWMMGDTGPCGPCSEIHVDLTSGGDTKGSLVNKGDARCIEIWNHVFIQYNANPDGGLVLLPSKHVDTGMGLERVTGIIQNTKGFTDFTRVISNYETDIFHPIFARLEKMSGKKYASTLPAAGASGGSEQEKIDIAFRVIADHIRTLTFAIADGIQPGNTDRNYVLRRILRRAVGYGRTLGFNEPFFYKLVDVLVENMGHIFPEIRAKRNRVEELIFLEEEAFNKTLDKGLAIFERRLKVQPDIDDFFVRFQEEDLIQTTRHQLKSLSDIPEAARRTISEINNRFEKSLWASPGGALARIAAVASGVLTPRDLEWFKKLTELHVDLKSVASLADMERSSLSEGFFAEQLHRFSEEWPKKLLAAESAILSARLSIKPGVLPGEFAFILYDTYGFPLDLTELMARERGLTVDVPGFNKLMEEQKARARAAQKKQVIELSQIETATPTRFVGYEALESPAKVLEAIGIKDKTAIILDSSSLYAEMGGQVGDTGELEHGSQLWRITNTQKSGNTWLHFVEVQSPESKVQSDDSDVPAVGSEVTISVDRPRRNAIQRHHTVTHLFHWALHEVVSKDASQKGSYVGPEKLTFDFNCAPLTPQQIANIEKLVNERILENAGVSWTEVPYADVKSRKDVMQFFGDKYGEKVRVVQIGGKPAALDGYSMELCGGTHTRATGEIGLFRIVGESAIAAGVRRVEAVAGLEAYKQANDQLQLIRAVAGKVNSPVGELEKKIESLLAQQKELEKQLKSANQKQAAETARSLATKSQTIGSTNAIIANLGGADGDVLQSIADSLKGQFKGVVVLGGAANGSVALVATVTPDLTKQFQAGKIIQTIAPIVGGKGGGKPDNARGGGKDVAKLDEALAKAKELLSL